MTKTQSIELSHKVQSSIDQLRQLQHDLKLVAFSTEPEPCAAARMQGKVLEPMPGEYEKDDFRKVTQWMTGCEPSPEKATPEAQCAAFRDICGEIVAYGDCQCDLPHGEVCIVCEIEKLINNSDCGKGYRSPEEYAGLGQRLLDLQNQFMAFQRASNERIESLTGGKGYKSPAEVREMLPYLHHLDSCHMPSAPCTCGLEALLKEANATQETKA